MSKLSDKERLALLQDQLNSLKDWGEVDKELSLQITQIEREFKIVVDGEFPLMKLQQMTDDLYIISKREEKAANKNKPRTPRRR